jgi:catechol 2,3-dioxygenase-like lactoylglutathione lyase family enzyme
MGGGRDTRDGPPRLFRVIVPVADIDAATRFYQALLGLEGERISSGRHYFRCGGAIVACFDPVAEEGAREAKPNVGHIYFAVGDLEAYYERARQAGCRWLEDRPKHRGWGERSFYARDPFGNPLCFVDGGTVFTGATLSDLDS